MSRKQNIALLVIPSLLLCLLMSAASVAADAREFSKISFLDVRDGFIKHSSRMTEVQQEDAWRQFAGKWVRWTGIVRDVTTTWGTLNIHVDMGVGSFGTDIMLCPTEAMIPVAKKLAKGERIFFSGRLDKLPGKFLATALRDVEITNPRSADDYYPICIKTDDVIFGFASPKLINHLAENNFSDARTGKLISKAISRGEAGSLKAGRCIVLTGETSGAASLARVLDADNDSFFWIPTNYVRNRGVPVASPETPKIYN